MATCYRHPGRETGVSCSNCGRPICPDCMTPTPVGMRCPECARERTPVKTMRSMQTEPRVVFALLALNVIAYLASGQFGVGNPGGGSNLFRHFALDGPDIHFHHEYWRLVSGGFLHAGFLHIGFNMYLLYVLGRLLEPVLGSVRFGLLYFAALLAGSAGALLVTPDSYTVGASGAVFGLMGAAFVMQRARGIDPMQSGVGPIILLNLAISFLVPNISIGGHLGGLVGGAVAAFAMDRLAGVRRGVVLPVAACLAIGAVAAVAAVAVSGRASGLAG